MLTNVETAANKKCNNWKYTLNNINKDWIKAQTLMSIISHVVISILFLCTKLFVHGGCKDKDKQSWCTEAALLCLDLQQKGCGYKGTFLPVSFLVSKSWSGSTLCIFKRKVERHYNSNYAFTSIQGAVRACLRKAHTETCSCCSSWSQSVSADIQQLQFLWLIFFLKDT